MSRDQPVNLVILRHICIEKIKRNSPNASKPCPSDDLAAANVNRNGQAAAIGVKDGRQCQFRFKNVIVSLLLQSIVPDLLPKISEAVKQPDRRPRQVEITCRFEMIARQNAEAAGIIGK